MRSQTEPPGRQNVLGAATIQAIAGLPRERGDVRIFMNPGKARPSWLRGITFGPALGVCAVLPVPSPAHAAMTEEAASAANPAAPAPGTASPEAIPFSGNVELKGRLDAAGKLIIAGERMHPALLRRFYAAHGYQTVWDAHPVEVARLREVVLRADYHGLDPGLFHAAAFGDRAARLTPVEHDILMSDAFLSYADALARGAMPIEDRADDEDLTPEPVDVVALLDSAIAAPDPAKVIEALAPASPEYVVMRRAYMEYQTAASAAPAARGRPERGAVDKATAERRLRQIVVNLERLRWLPRQMPRDRVMVNAAIARLQLMRDDRPVFTTRVVVGEIEKQTPEFRTTIDSILFNPPWNIPRSIAQSEILPKLAADPGYLASHHMRVRSNGAIQQEAGPYSALGRLKFEMIDRYDVYLHDTPTKSLFQAAARMMSHGCVRVENPRALAALLLGQGPEVIDKGIASGRTHRRLLPAAIPIFIVYQSTFVESDGSIQFRSDPYERDEEIWRYLNRAKQLPIAQEAASAQRKG
jgi:murein L,D-transpeptidase YcbB/YkuD